MFQERGKSEVARVLCRAIASVRGRSLDAREMKLSTCSCIPNGFLTQLARQCWGGAEVATMLQARWCEVFALFGLRPFQWLGFVAWCVCSIPSVSATLFLPLMLRQIIYFVLKQNQTFGMSMLFCPGFGTNRWAILFMVAIQYVGAVRAMPS